MNWPAHSIDSGPYQVLKFLVAARKVKESKPSSNK